MSLPCPSLGRRSSATPPRLTACPVHQLSALPRLLALPRGLLPEGQYAAPTAPRAAAAYATSALHRPSAAPRASALHRPSVTPWAAAVFVSPPASLSSAAMVVDAELPHKDAA